MSKILSILMLASLLCPAVSSADKSDNNEQVEVVEVEVPPSPREYPIGKALSWIREHQEKDGSWSPEKHGGVVADKQRDTSLALLAFTNAGNSSRFGKYRNNVGRAIEWLHNRQQKSGRVSAEKTLPKNPLEKFRAIVDHAYAANALIECYGMSEGEAQKEHAQKSLDWLIAQKPFDLVETLKGNKDITDSDVGGLAWMIFAAKSAEMSRLSDAKDFLAKANEYLITCDKYVDKTKRFGFFGRPASPRDTVIGAFLWYITGGKSQDTLSGVEWALGQPGMLPDWGKDGKNVDWSYLYFGTLSCTRYGWSSKPWRTWSPLQKKTLLSSQIAKGTYKESKGSWPAVTKPEKRSSVFTTAIGSLCLSVYYIY